VGSAAGARWCTDRDVLGQVERRSFLGGYGVTCGHVSNNLSCACERLERVVLRQHRAESTRHTTAPSLARLAVRDAMGECGCVASGLRKGARRDCGRAAGAALSYEPCPERPAAHATRRALQARLSVRPVVTMRKVRALKHAGAAQRQARGLTALLGGVAEPARRLSVLRGPSGGLRGSKVRTWLGGTRMVCSQRLASQVAWARALGERRTRQRRP
jgi:hypothetical protein